jgi:hypothetical protein
VLLVVEVNGADKLTKRPRLICAKCVEDVISEKLRAEGIVVVDKPKPVAFS